MENLPNGYYQTLMKDAEKAFSDEDYDRAGALFLEACDLDPSNAAAVLYGGISFAMQDGASYNRLIDAASAVERAVELTAEKYGPSEEYFAFCSRAVSAMIDTSALHYESLLAWCGREGRKKNGTSGSGTDELLRDGIGCICAAAKKTVGAVLENTDDMANADDFFRDSTMTLLDNAEAYRAAADMEEDTELTEIFGVLRQLSGELSGCGTADELLPDNGEYVEITCPSCGETLSFPGEDLPKSGKTECPFCGNRF